VVRDRVLEERAELLRKVAERARPATPGAALRLEEGARDALEKALLIRQTVESRPAPVAAMAGAGEVV
jgi:hypothetical protein